MVHRGVTATPPLGRGKVFGGRSAFGGSQQRLRKARDTLLASKVVGRGRRSVDWRHQSASGRPAVGSLLANEEEVNETIDAILEDIKGTDSGASVSDEKRQKIDANIEKLIELSNKKVRALLPRSLASRELVRLG